MTKSKKPIVLKVILIVWVIFTTLYLIYGEYSRLNNYVAQSAYKKGYQDSIMRLVSESSSCQPIPVGIGGQNVDFIALNCLTPPASEMPMVESEELPE